MALYKHKGFRDKYPGIPGRALEFFQISNATKTPEGVIGRTVWEFASTYAHLGPDGKTTQSPETSVLVHLLDEICKMGFLTKLSGDTLGGFGDRYLARVGEDQIQGIGDALNYKIYGFEAVYDDFRNTVLPVIYRPAQGDVSIGSSFLGPKNTIFTAAHCIKGAASLSIKGITPEQFANAGIYITKNEALDLALIRFDQPVLPDIKPLNFNTGEILGEVLALGYPNVPGFTEMLAAEKAAISSRITATKGAIASKAKEIFANTELFLITAKVRGGFSGGPIIDDWGRAAGIVSRQPVSQNSADTAMWDKYDNLGYGVVIPTEEIDKFWKACSENNEAYFERIAPASLGYTVFPSED